MHHEGHEEGNQMQAYHEVHEDQGKDDVEQHQTNRSQDQKFQPTPETGHRRSFLSAKGIKSFIKGT